MIGGAPPQVMMLSLWRNDESRQLAKRVSHLLEKTRYPFLRMVWVVGDCAPGDRTEDLLRDVAQLDEWFIGRAAIDVVRCDSGVERRPGVHADRLLALTVAANAGLDRVRPSDDYVLIHESDLRSPIDVVERLLAHAAAGRCPIAGWPTLGPIFYDTFAYRQGGARFVNHPPYHACYRADVPFEVDSVGSLWMLDAADVRAGARCGAEGGVDLCTAVKARGGRVWVDPTLPVEQPRDLWVPHAG